MRMSRDRFSLQTVVTATDAVLCAWSMPAETTMLSVKANVKMTSVTDHSHINSRVAYALDGWFLELPDDLMESAVETIYDALVPKYKAALSFDFEDETPDTDPGYEPGQIRNDLLGTVDDQRHIYQRRKILGFPDHRGYHETTPGTVWAYIPVDSFSISRKGPRTAKAMSAVIFSASSPANDALTSENKLFPTFGGSARSEWLWLRYLDQMLDNAVVAMLGLTETGAETPYEELLDLIEFEISSANVMSAQGILDTSWQAWMAGTMEWKTGARMRIQLASD